jgi:hypothetical protein
MYEKTTTITYKWDPIIEGWVEDTKHVRIKNNTPPEEEKVGRPIDPNWPIDYTKDWRPLEWECKPVDKGIPMMEPISGG